MGKESDFLEYEANISIFDGKTSNWFPFDENLSAVWLNNARNTFDQCAFAAPARAKDADVLFVLDEEAHVVESPNIAIGLRDILYIQRWRPRPSPVPFSSRRQGTGKS